MWWSRALVLLLLVALGPVGCGFRPLYGKTDAVQSPEAADMASVRVMGIPDRTGQQLRNFLVQRLTPQGEPAKPTYQLTVTITESLEGLAESQNGKATIGRLQASATYELTDAKTGQRLMSGNARSVTSMRYLGPRYASVVTERDTEQSALTDVAEQIRNGLAAWFANRRAHPELMQPPAQQ